MMSTSSGREACMSWMRRPSKLPAFSFKALGERTFIRWLMPISDATASSATHQALEKSRKSRSTAMTWPKPRSVAASQAIMSSNLFISQLMLAPSSRSGWLVLPNFAAPQLQRGNSRPVTASFPWPQFVLQMPACWFTEKAHTQYARPSTPLASSHCSSFSGSTSSSSATFSKFDSRRASATMAATRSRKRFPQLCVTMLCGRVGAPFISTSAMEDSLAELRGMMA
mmetsp:Transcript_91884/g.287583  ORF Transcript_91884/g.287583 Transcript_91884/m.287583 type:complete len:226 (-) Transcript_91884:197-874(-)